MFADLCLIGDDFAVVSNKACVEVEDDVDEEKDVHHGIKNQHCDITCVARSPLEISNLPFHCEKQSIVKKKSPPPSHF